MSTLMDEEIKRWTAKRKTALVLEIIQGKTSVCRKQAGLRPAAVGDRELAGRRPQGHGERPEGPTRRMFVNSTNAS